MTNEQNLVMLYTPNQIGDMQYYNQPQASFLINSYGQPVYCMQSPQGVFDRNDYLNFQRNFTHLQTTNFPHEAENFDLMIRIAENAYYWVQKNGYFTIENVQNFLTDPKNCRAKNYVEAGCYIGWFQKQEGGNAATYGFTDLGKYIFAQRYYPYYISWIVNSVLNNPIFYQCACFCSKKGYFPNENEFKQIVEYAFRCNNLEYKGWAPTTLEQRRITCMNWVNEIIRLITPSPYTASCFCQ